MGTPNLVSIDVEGVGYREFGDTHVNTVFVDRR
jgi:hypothetical protein